MKHLKKYNETVWTNGDITGSRAIWAEQVLSTLEDVGIVISSKVWNEPPTKPYEMSYEMGTNRLLLTIGCKSSDSTLSNVMDGLYSFMEQIKPYNVGILKCRIEFTGSLDEDDPDDKLPLAYELFEVDINGKEEKQLIDFHGNCPVTKIILTLKKFSDYSEYNIDYIKKYQDYFRHKSYYK